jgi:hypothetical protein
MRVHIGGMVELVFSITSVRTAADPGVPLEPVITT